MFEKIKIIRLKGLIINCFGEYNSSSHSKITEEGYTSPYLITRCIIRRVL